MRRRGKGRRKRGRERVVPVQLQRHNILGVFGHVRFQVLS